MTFCEKMNRQSAPPNWHFAVNFPVALVWIVGIPLAICTFLQIPLWWVILIVPSWMLLTGRITDRWIPALTGLAVDRAFVALRSDRKTRDQLEVESDYTLEITDLYIRSTLPDGSSEVILWDELSGIDIETNSLGPFAPDVFWILHGEEQDFIVPQGAAGSGSLLERFQQLPRFDNNAFIEAMASTSDATFEIWRKTSNTEQGVDGNLH